MRPRKSRFKWSLILLVLIGAFVMSGFASSQADSPSCGEALFLDDFSDPQSGWSTEARAGFDRAYSDGEYRLFVTNANWIAWSWAPLDTTLPGNFCLQSNVKQLVQGSLSDFGAVGLIFAGNRDDDSFTVFEIASSGYYRILRSTEESRNVFVEWTESEIINDVGQFNHLRIQAGEAQVGFFINDVEVESLALPTAGAVGVITRTFDEPNVNGRFDNYSINRLQTSD